MARDPVVTLETLVSLGFQRVLTSGCDTSALEGLPVIKRLIDQVCLARGVCVHVCLFIVGTYCLSPYVQAKERILVMPGESALPFFPYYFIFSHLLDIFTIDFRRRYHGKKLAEDHRGVWGSGVSLLGTLK